MADFDLHLDMVAAAMAEQARHLDALVAEVRRLRGLLARALPHIDPNDSDDAYFLVHAIKEATR